MLEAEVRVVGEVACAFAGMVWVQITATHLWARGPATRDLPRPGEENRTSLAEVAHVPFTKKPEQRAVQRPSSPAQTLPRVE